MLKLKTSFCTVAKSYAGDDFYFKSGAYGQCSVKDEHPVAEQETLKLT